MSATQIRDKADATIETLKELLERTQEIRSGVDEIVREDPVPLFFSGIVRNYRFGNGDGSAPNGMPSHRFEVECDGGLWLHVSVGSDKFDPFFKEAKLGLFTGADNHPLDGLVIEVARDLKYGRLVPRQVFGPLIEGKDSEGKTLWIGATVETGAGNRVPIIQQKPSGGDRPIVIVKGDFGEKSYYTDTITRV